MSVNCYVTLTRTFVYVAFLVFEFAPSTIWIIHIFNCICILNHTPPKSGSSASSSSTVGWTIWPALERTPREFLVPISISVTWDIFVQVVIPIDVSLLSLSILCEAKVAPARQKLSGRSTCNVWQGYFGLHFFWFYLIWVRALPLNRSPKF